MTIKDVAKMAGVSPSTVSRVVNKGDEKSASPETQKKIWAAVNSLGYTPNLHARSLKTNQPDIADTPREIACVYGRLADSYINPFFGQLMHAVEKAAYSRRYFLQFSSTEAPTDSPQKGNSASAVIILGKTDTQTLDKLKANYRHIVYTGLQDLPLEIDQVISNGYDAAGKAVQYLLELGHKKICYIGETKNEQRFLAYKDVMKEAGLDFSWQNTVSIDFSPSQGYEATSKLLKQNTSFTAILCANDMLALGALKALKDNHKKVPDDISLISIDDIETASYLTPMLTTVRIPIEEMGSMAVNILIDRIEGRHKSPIKVNLPNTVIYRDSCGKCHSRK